MHRTILTSKILQFSVNHDGTHLKWIKNKHLRKNMFLLHPHTTRCHGRRSAKVDGRGQASERAGGEQSHEHAMIWFIHLDYDIMHPSFMWGLCQHHLELVVGNIVPLESYGATQQKRPYWWSKMFYIFWKMPPSRPAPLRVVPSHMAPLLKTSVLASTSLWDYSIDHAPLSQRENEWSKLPLYWFFSTKCL